MPEFDERTKAIIEAPTDRPVKIVAGAGTGKTWTLVQRFLWLTRPDGGNYGPSCILAITFTEKAADEMQSRIRAALSREGRATETALNIHTFHGFGARLLREYGSASDVAPDVKVLDEVQQRAVQRRLFRDACEGRLDVDGLRPGDLAALDVKTLKDHEAFCRTVIAKGKGLGLSEEEFRAEAASREDDFWRVLPTPGAVHDTGYGDALTEFLHGALDAGFDCRPFDDVKKNSGDPRKVYWTRLNKNKDLQPEIRPNLAETFRLQKEATIRVLDSAAAFWKAYDAELQRLGALDYDDLINRAVDLLRNTPEVRQDVQRRFRYLLVDEFQDTSPAQMELLRFVSTEVDCDKCGKRVPGNVTVVGDKKQAIYGWRNARKENMDEFVPCGHEETLKCLTTSRRCRDMVRELANTIGKRVEPADPCLEPLEESEKETRVNVPGPFEGANIAEARKKEARYIAERIQWLVDSERGEDRRAYRDIAVLLRKASLFRDLRETFRERNIPYVFESAAGLMEEPCAKDAVAFLCVVATPHDDAAWYRLLHRKPVALCDAELVGLKKCGSDHFEATLPDSGNERVEELLHLVADARARAAEMPLADFLSGLPRASGLWDAWDRDDREVWPQVLAALEAAARQAEALQAGAGLQDLIELLDTYADDDALQMPTAPTEAAGVRVLTVHKAKGLEFPVVFVPDIATKGRTDTGWLWDDDWGLIPDLSSGDSVKRTFWKWLRKRDAREDEESRVWYVAATRAKDVLTVTGTLRKTDEDDLAKRIDKSTLPNDFKDGPVWNLATHELEPSDWETSVRRRRRPAGAESAPAQPERARGTVRSLATSYSALTAMDFCPLKAWLDHHWAWPDVLLTPFEPDGSRRLGDLFHLAAARWYNGLRDGLPDAVCVRGDSDGMRDELRAVWQAFRDSPWSAVEAVAVERSVCWRTNIGGIDVEVRGFVDLVYRDEDGRLAVCDFKTGKPSDSHANQLCLYRMALMQEGADVAEEGVAVHPGSDGIQEERFRLPDHEAAVREGLERYLSLVSADLPEPPAHPQCRTCRYREACPRSPLEPSDTPGNDAVACEDDDLFGPEWRPVVSALRKAGWTVEEADEVKGRLPAFAAHRGDRLVIVWPEGAAPPDDGHRHVVAGPADPTGLVARLEGEQ